MKHAFVLSLLAGLANAATAASFIDQTFNLADYDSLSYPQGAGTVDIAQTATGGNPGPALQVTSSATLTNASFAVDTYFFNHGFTYDPAIGGTVGSIVWSQDIYGTVLSGPSLSSQAAFLLVRQNGNVYIAGVGLPVRPNIFQTAAQTIATAGSLYLISNPALGTIDTTRHPDFAGGVMQFGFDVGATLRASGPAQTVSVLERVDNFGVTVIAAVPEPSSVWLLAGGAMGLATALQRRRQSLPWTQRRD